MLVTRECYTPHPMALNATLTLDCTQLAAFIATTAGTITITDSSGLTLLNAQPVAAGQYLPLPFSVVSRTAGNNSTTIVLAGGASGLLLV